MDFNDSPEEAAWRAECRKWLQANAPSVAGPNGDASSMFEPGGPDYLERAQRWQALKFDAGFARIRKVSPSIGTISTATRNGLSV